MASRQRSASRKAGAAAAAARGCAMQEVVRQQGDVLAALAQRRHTQSNDVQAVEQVVAESAAPHLGGRGRDWWRQSAAHRLDAPVAAHALELALLQHAQQLGLRAPAPSRRFRPGRPCRRRPARACPFFARRAGECALLVAEELAFEQRLGQRRAVDGDEGLRRARAER